MRLIRQSLGSATIAAILLALGLLLFSLFGARPQDLPWTPLDLGEPVGLFTGRKLAGLTRDFPRCRALLGKAGIAYELMPPAQEGTCGYADGVRFTPGGSRETPYTPNSPTLSCPVAAALSVWEWDVVQPAARRLLGSEVVAFEHLGSYNCRHIAGSTLWSEHAADNAIDIAGVRLANGKRITLLANWKGNGPAATFLHEIRNGACMLFATTLSPDYNAAHENHLHLDQAARGQYGWRACR